MADVHEEVEEEIVDTGEAGDDGGKQGDGTEGLSPIEKIAMDAGWKPESDWRGDKTNWTDAETFLRSLADKAQDRGKQLKEREKRENEIIEKRVKAMERTMEATRQRELKQTKAYYEDLIRKAIKDGDEELESELRQELDGIVEEHESAAELTPEQLEEAEQDWVDNFTVANPKIQKPFWEQHAWLLDDETDIEDFMIAEEVITKATNAGKTLHQAMKAAEEELMAVFPDRYDVNDQEEDEPQPERKTSRAKPRVPVLASASRASGKTKASRLPPEARATAKRYIDEGLYGSYEEYAEEYEKAGGELLQ